jgi:hypothetical protein
MCHGKQHKITVQLATELNGQSRSLALLHVLSQIHGALCHGTKRSWGVMHNQAELYVRFGREITALVHDELAGCKYGQHAAGPSRTGGGGRG